METPMEFTVTPPRRDRKENENVDYPTYSNKEDAEKYIRDQIIKYAGEFHISEKFLRQYMVIFDDINGVNIEPCTVVK